MLAWKSFDSICKQIGMHFFVSVIKLNEVFLFTEIQNLFILNRSMLFRQFFFPIFIFGICFVQMFAGEFEILYDDFMKSSTFSSAAVRLKTKEILNNQKSLVGENFIYNPRGYYQISSYLKKDLSVRGVLAYSILEITNFIEEKQKSADEKEQEIAFLSICELIPSLYYSLFLKNESSIKSANKQRECLALLLCLENAWLAPYFNSPLIKNNKNLSMKFANAYESHLVRARSYGTIAFPYACKELEKFIPKYIDNDIGRARTYYWLSWMYLKSKQYRKAKIAAKKIPKIPGMKDVGTRFVDFANKEEKELRNQRRKK